MSTVSDLLIQDAKDYHLRILQSYVGKDDLAASFCVWLLPQRLGHIRIDKVASSAGESKGASRTLRTVATLGFAMENPGLRQQFETSFRSGLKWLVGRSSRLDGTATGIISDGVAFLGVVLGVYYLDDAAIKSQFSPWRTQVISEVQKSSGLDGLQKSLFCAASCICLPEGIDLKVEESIVPELLCALTSKGVFQRAAEPSASALEISRRIDYRKDEWAIAAIRLACLDWLTGSAPAIELKSVTVKDVATLLHRVQNSFLRWVWEEKPRVKRAGAVARKWHIDNEYHVQAVLWAVLSPIFPDLKEEEYLSSVAHLQPRSDLCIPSLKLIIEVKFWYAKQKPQDLIEEISGDAALYLKPDSGFNEVIAVVWDDEARVEDHGLFQQGLKSVRGIRDVIFISKPSIMRPDSNTHNVNPRH